MFQAFCLADVVSSRDGKKHPANFPKSTSFHFMIDQNSAYLKMPAPLFHVLV